MNVWIDPDQMICIFCNQEISKNAWSFTYDCKKVKEVNKDGITYYFKSEFYHIECAKDNLYKLKQVKKKWWQFW